MSCPDASAFSAFVSGALDAGARTELELHLDTCDTCRILLSETIRGSAATLPAPRELPLIGDTVGRYTIVGELGAGAMGVVYLARDPELDRELAIKLVQPQVGSAEDELVQQRMLREGRVLARIDHPNVVRVFDVGRWHGALFVAMERAPGTTLREWLAAGGSQRRSTAQIVDVFAQCAAGLAAAHEAGVVHRDFKPDNVVVDDSGRARVTDFGLAITEVAITEVVVPDEVRTAPTAPMHAVTAVEQTIDQRLTRTQGIVGTPAYMAPEQHRGVPIDGRADQFALCVALAEALGGERPFATSSSTSIDERLAQIRAGRPRLAASIPRRVRRVIERGLAYEPAQRFDSMHALARALASAPRWRWWFLRAGGAAAIALAIGAVGLRGDKPDPCAGATATMDRTWDVARQVQLAAAFASAGKPFAGPAWTYTQRAVDRYAVSWRSARIGACSAAAAQAGAAQSGPAATIRCLDRRAGELDAVLARWEQGAVETLAAAPFAADGLASIERCATAELDPAPATAIERARVAELEKRFFGARADDLAGRTAASAAALEALLPDLAAASLHVLRAEALFTLAGTERELGKSKQAREHLMETITTAEIARASRTKARAWIALAELIDEDAIRLEEARDALRLADAISEQLGRPAELESERLVASGLVALHAGDHRAALSALRSSVASEFPLHVSESTRRRQILARALIAASEIQPALAELERAEAELTAALGPSTPYLVPVINSMVEPLDYLGRRDDAVARGLRALAIFDASYGAANPRRVQIVNNVAIVYANQDKYDRALELLEEVLATKIRVHGEQSNDVAIARQNLASTLIDAGRAAPALDHLDRALAILTKSLGADHPLVANVHSSLAGAHARLDHPEEALAHARRALAIREQAELGAGHIAYSRYELAQILVATGKRAEGIALAKRALELPLAATGREGTLAAALRELIEQQQRR